MKSLSTKSVRAILQQRLRHSYLECAELAATTTRKNLKTRAQHIRDFRSAGLHRDPHPVPALERYSRREVTLANNQVIGYHAFDGEELCAMVLPTAVGLHADLEARTIVRALSELRRGCDTSYLVWKPHGLLRIAAVWCEAGTPPLFVILHGNPRGFLIGRYGMEPGTDPLSLFNRLVTLCISPDALADFLARDPIVGKALRQNPTRPIVIVSCGTGGLGELVTESSGRQLARRLGQLGFSNQVWAPNAKVGLSIRPKEGSVDIVVVQRRFGDPLPRFLLQND